MFESEFEIRPRRQFRSYLERDKRWACMVVHRRGGKTFGCIQDLLNKAFTTERAGPPLRFAYIAPTRDQAKDIAWGYIKTFLSPLPGVKINEADLIATLPNGATIRLYSGESYERMRGLYLDGVVIDEYADIDPAAWHSVIRPCLSDYNGWATFIGTNPDKPQIVGAVNFEATNEEKASQLPEPMGYRILCAIPEVLNAIHAAQVRRQ